MNTIKSKKIFVKPFKIAAAFSLLSLMLVALSSKAQLVATGYTWSQSLQTYKSDTSTTSVTPANIFSTGWDDNTYTTYKFPFNFTYNGTLYTGGTSTIGIDTDGWMAFSTAGTIAMTGTGAGGSWVSISDHTGVYLNGTANNNGICGFNSDVEDQSQVTFTGNTLSGSVVVSSVTDFSNLRVGTRLSGTGITNGTIVTKLNPTTSSITISAPATITGTAAVLTPWGSIYAFIRGVAPYRQFVVQWTRVTRFGTAGDDFSFQIVLNEGGLDPVYQTLQAVYGDCKATNLTAQNSQVGLRGASAADFNARKTATNWSTTAAATLNTDVCVLTPAIFPASGLTYTWSPACGAVPSNAAAISGPLNVCPGTSVDYSIPGVPGAIFYNWTYTGTNTTLSGTSTLPVNTLIFANTATGGTLTVTPGNLCGTSASSSVVIAMNGLPSASISYPASSYCTSAAAVTPTITGTAGGTFTALPVGLTINPSTGQVTPLTSSAGNYVVTYTFTSGCTATATTNITINAGPAIVATATPAAVCSSPNSSQLQATVPVSGYSLNSIAYASLTPSAGSTIVWNTYQLDAISGSIPMPFTFNYFGSAITNFFVSSEGYIQLQTGTAVEWVRQTLPNATIPNNIVCLAWDDLIVDPVTNPGSSVRYFVNGIAPNRILVIDYINLRFLGGTSAQNITGQLRLYESDSHIEIAAGTVNDNGAARNKTMGIENSTGTAAVTPPGRNNTTWNTTSEAWSFVPTTNTYSYLWSPATYLTNAAIANPVANNLAATTNYTVTVTNTNTGCSGTGTATVTVTAPLNGTYTVGVGGNYTTLTAAVNAYNTACIGGPVVFSLIDNTYPSETFPIVINSNAAASAVNTLTIKPALTKLPVITGNSAAGIIKLNGADWVTIDGSNTVGGITKNLTLINTSTNTSTSSIVWLASVAAGNGATNNTVKNCNFTGNSPTTTFTSLLSSGVIAGTVAEAANNNNTYTNNFFIRTQTAIAVVGPTGNETGTVINDNIIGSVNPTDKLGWSGIEIYQQANCKVKNNTIFGISSSDFSITTSGISVYGTQSNDTISNNKISDIKHTNSGGYGANGIYLGASTTSSDVFVFNNFIFDVAGYGFNDFNYYDNGYGLVIDFGGGYKIYHNTVQMNGNATSTGNHRSAAVLVSNFVTTASSVDMRNNIFGNIQTVGGANSRYAILCTAANTVFSFNDNNAYYSTGSTWLSCKGSNATQTNTIAALRTSLGSNLASVGLVSSPTYVGSTDYHLQSVAANSTVSNLGVAIPTFTVDFDGNTRNGYTPDMGADEFVMPNAGSWVGRKSIDWLDPINWEDNVVPNGTTDVTLTGGYVNMPTIVTTQAVRGLAISAPVPANTPLLTLTNSTLQINGAFTRTAGTIIANTGTVEMNSTTAAQSIPANVFQNNNLLNLVIGNTNNVTGVTIGGTLDIYRSVTFSAGGLRLTTGGLLTFKSTATETAWLGNVTGKTITGNATIERYIPTGINHGKSWQLLAAPVRGAQSVFASWQELNAPLANARPGFGTTISSEKVNATARGYDFYTAAGGPSIKTYDPVTNLFVGIDNGVANTSAVAISNQKGYMVFVRGDRSVQTFGAAAVPTVLRTNGGLYTATAGQLPPVTTVLANKFATIGNPYPSAIDFTSVTRAPGVDDVFYLWDPLLAGSFSLGGYQTFSAVTGYLPTPGSVNYPAAVPMTRIQSGQAFYVHGTAGGNVSFTEAAKVSGSQLVLRPGAAVQNRKLLAANLYKISTLNLGAMDGNTVAFDKDFSNLFNGQDALKINHADENFALSSNQRLLSVEARKPVKNNDTIFYHISNLRQEAYQFRFGPRNLQASNLHAYLVDAYMGTMTDISLTDSTLFDFTVNADVASGASSRFYLVFKKQEVLPVTFTQISAKRNTDAMVKVEWKVENESGIQLYEVEKSADGKKFVRFDDVKPANTIAYNSLDKSPLALDNFYRVKAISNSGLIQYSAVVKVAALPVSAGIAAYPNPVTEKILNVSFNNQPAGTYQVRVLNKMGQLTLSRSVEISGNNVIVTIPFTKDISTGSYQLIISNEEGSKFTQQLIIN